MEKAARPMNDTPTCSTAQLARVSRLIQMGNVPNLLKLSKASPILRRRFARDEKGRCRMGRPTLSRCLERKTRLSCAERLAASISFRGGVDPWNRFASSVSITWA
jgi:hypothetical protein